MKSATLQQAVLSLVPNNECNTFYRNVKKVERGVQDIMLCASDPEGRRDTCSVSHITELKISVTMILLSVSKTVI